MFYLCIFQNKHEELSWSYTESFPAAWWQWEYGKENRMKRSGQIFGQTWWERQLSSRIMVWTWSTKWPIYRYTMDRGNWLWFGVISGWFLAILRFRLENKIIPSFFLKHVGWRVMFFFFFFFFWDATANHHSWFIEAIIINLAESWRRHHDITKDIQRLQLGEIIPKGLVSGWWFLFSQNQKSRNRQRHSNRQLHHHSTSPETWVICPSCVEYIRQAEPADEWLKFG